MNPDIYTLAKAGLNENEIHEILCCENTNEQIRLLRKHRFKLLDEIHETQQALDGIDYMISLMKNQIKRGKIMKKFTAFLLTVFIALSLAACGGNGSSSEGTSSAPERISEKVSMPETGETDTESAETTEDVQTVQKTEENAEETDTGNDTAKSGTKILVAYFSATGTTKALAEYAADVLGADLYEITPEEPYTDDDLNYSDNSSRSTVEQNDSSARPAISGSVESMEQYEIVFLGFPIWWGEEPRIMDTFVESYDFSGKTIVPFCTSGGSGFGSSGRNLQALSTGEATWLDGARLGSSSSREDIVDWINGLGLDVTAE